MTDRELLELAAKAIHLGHAGFHGGRGLRLPWYDGSPEADSGWWNPLADDGDALRLAVKLNLDILQDPSASRSNAVEVTANEAGVDVQPWAWEVRAPDPYAATRRAIVRAAAEMAKA